MKQYKIGDTIYIKDTIVAINIDDTISAYRGGYNGWLSNRTIIDELPTAEPVKPVLPKDVADEMSYAKSIKDITFDGYIIRELIYSGYDDSATKIMIQSHDVPNAMEALLNAWNNGYTIAAEPKYYVYIALPYNTDIGGKYYDNDGDFYDCGQLWRNSTDRLCSRAAVQAKLYTADRYQFTKEEIDQLRKDYPAIEIKEVNIND